MGLVGALREEVFRPTDLWAPLRPNINEEASKRHSLIGRKDTIVV